MLRFSKKILHKNHTRFVHQAVIHNSYIESRNGTFECSNPATGQVFGEVSNCSVAETTEAIQSAKDCFKHFSRSLPSYRAQLLCRWADLININNKEIAEMITMEMGKPLKESIGEVAYATSFLYHFASLIKTGLTGETLAPGQTQWRPLNIRQPVGPVATITPWNFPVAMITRKAGAAIAAGCSVINAPSEDTPIVALHLAKLGIEAGFPDGLLNVLPSSRENKPALGEILCKHPDIAAMSFTGSTEVGKLLIRQCADTVTRVHMELGGNAPLIVFDSADVERALNATMMAKFKNAGQACNAANRLFVHSSIYSEFVEKLSQRILALRMGNGMERKTDIGPLVNTKGSEKVRTIVKNTVNNAGIELIVSNENTDHSSDLPYYSPTLLSCNSNTNVSIFHEEIFGPVAALYSFDTEDEVIHLANSTRYGLQAYIFTRDLAQSWRVSEALEYGMVAVNEGAISSACNPFGGWKESGIGREAGHFGIDEFTENKLICFGL